MVFWKPELRYQYGGIDAKNHLYLSFIDSVIRRPLLQYSNTPIRYVSYTPKIISP